jgi:hypothetical protein
MLATYAANGCTTHTNFAILTTAQHTNFAILTISHLNRNISAFAQAAYYQRLGQRIMSDFQAAFLHTDMSRALYQGRHYYGNNVQGANAIVIGVGAIPKESNHTWGSIYRAAHSVSALKKSDVNL